MHPPPSTDELAAWFHERDLALPAWMLVEAVRPLGWVMGQLCLVAQPLLRGLGWDDALAATFLYLDDPNHLAALSRALAPDEVSDS